MKRLPFTLTALALMALSPAALADDGRVTASPLTHYEPIAGDSMQGHCGTSASGINACSGFIEDYLDGKTNKVIAAVPIKGAGTSGLFGGRYCSPELGQAYGKSGCFEIWAADHFAHGYKGQVFDGTNKMDIVAKGKKYSGGDTRSEKVDHLHQASMVPLGRISGVPAPQSSITRTPGATIPPDATRTPGNATNNGGSGVSGGSTGSASTNGGSDTSTSAASAASAAPAAAALASPKSSTPTSSPAKTSNTNNNTNNTSLTNDVGTTGTATTVTNGTTNGTNTNGLQTPIASDAPAAAAASDTGTNSILQNNYPLSGMLNSAAAVAGAASSAAKNTSLIRQPASTNTPDSGTAAAPGAAASSSSSNAVNGVSFDLGTSKGRSGTPCSPRL